MIKRSFFSLGKPGLRHHLVSAASGVKEVGLPSQVRLLVKGCDMGAIRLKVGSGVLTGQKVVLSGDADDYVLSTVTGTVSGISEYRGYMNESYAAIAIDVSGEDEVDGATVSALVEPGFDVAAAYLSCLPGESDFSSFL